MTATLVCRLHVLVTLLSYVHGLSVVIAGGTGRVGKVILPLLSNHDVSVLTRNSFLASAPNRVTEDFGYLGKTFLEKNPHVKLRDWDGGDLLDIVGQDWVGWSDDVLKKADVIVHMVGGYTEQRTKAAERLVQESYRLKSEALHITVNPVEADIPLLTPGMVTLKTKRIQDCENIVKDNCANTACLRLEAYKTDELCDEIRKTIDDWGP
ncbi:unnamed protein product [Cylindrotheca closterium]|uniref:NAD(P)-binding domain-containing protein n=1 Tax=Cylindrotheca closterium TaxID=2856 RepID=A0AAD2CRG6_9STRA|nr:unnamed protein product [Cylindrotheca closterium]